MYEIGGTVLYGAEGVCTIKDIADKEFGDSIRQYYILEPVYQKKSTVFVPTDSEQLSHKMRDVISPSDVDALIAEMPVEPFEWIKEDNARKEFFKGVISRCDCRELLRMISTLHLHREDVLEKGKKFGVVDTRFLKTAEKMVYDEFATSLRIEPEDVFAYIEKRVGKASRYFWQ